MSQKSTKTGVESEARSIQSEKAGELVHSMNVVKEIVTIIMALAFTNTLIHFFVDPSVSGTYAGKHLSEFGCTNCWIVFLIITTIIRFHHGNMIHLNKIYREDVLIENSEHSNIPFMFLFLFLEAFIFVLMSVYQRNIEYLFWLFVSLFFIDFCFFFPLEAVQQFKIGRKRKANRALNPKRSKIFGVKSNCETASLACIKIKRLIELIRGRKPIERVRKSLDSVWCAETRWAIANFITSIILLVLWGVMGDDLFEGSVYIFSVSVEYVYIFLGVVTLNLVFDYRLNWKFYFPTIPKT